MLAILATLLAATAGADDKTTPGGGADAGNPEKAPAASTQPPEAADPPAADLDADAVDLDAEAGSLPESAVSDTLRKNQWAITDCMSRLGGSALSGRVEARWDVSTTGVASGVTLHDSTLRNPPFEECIQKAVQRMKFPPARGAAVRVEHTFSF